MYKFIILSYIEIWHNLVSWSSLLVQISLCLETKKYLKRGIQCMGLLHFRPSLFFMLSQIPLEILLFLSGEGALPIMCHFYIALNTQQMLYQ